MPQKMFGVVLELPSLGASERGIEAIFLRAKGGMLRDNLREGNCESKIVAKHLGVFFGHGHLDVLQGPSKGYSNLESAKYPLKWSFTLVLQEFLSGTAQRQEAAQYLPNG